MKPPDFNVPLFGPEEESADTIAASRQSNARHGPLSRLKYAKPLDADEAGFAELIQRRQLLEKLAHLMQTSFAFREPLTLKLSRCRAPNADWDDEYREMVLCFELMKALADRVGFGGLLARRGMLDAEFRYRRRAGPM